MGKKNIVFNLTIDDLKELGIIKPKRRRRKTQRIMKYLQQQPSNIKSVSDHMTGYSNNFSNTSNLQTENLRLQNNLLNDTSNLKTENLRLQNDLLQNYPMIENNTGNFENRFKTIEDDNKKLNVFANHLLSTTYRPAIINYDDNLSPIQRRVESIDDNDPNHIVHNDDNNDVAATGGSDEFKTLDNKNDDPQPEIDETPQPQPQPQQIIQSPQQIVQSPQQIVESPQQQQLTFQSPKQIGIRSPFKMLLKSLRPSRNQNIPDSIYDMANNTPVDTSIPQQGYNYKLREDGSEYPEEEKKDDNKIISLTEESLKAHNTKTLTAYQVQKARREQAIEEYKALGGDKKHILESKTLGPIRMETVLLQSQLEEQEPQPEPRPKRNKNKNNNK